METEFWLNLPVKEIERSKVFFEKIGFKIGSGHGNTPTSAPLIVGSKSIVIMLFEEPMFEGFVNQKIANTDLVCEVLLSISAASKNEVDEISQKVVDAGGKTNHKPYNMDGPMYGCVFSDLDGHKWNILHIKKG